MGARRNLMGAARTSPFIISNKVWTKDRAR